MRTALKEIHAVPMENLRLSDLFQLELARNLTDVRIAAALARRSHGEWHTSYLRYLIGRLHGGIFAFTSALVYQSGDYDYLDCLGTSAMHEADFLCGEYLHGGCV